LIGGLEVSLEIDIGLGLLGLTLDGYPGALFETLLFGPEETGTGGWE
jgi:hypothetical protein